MIYPPLEDSFLLASQVKKYAKGKAVLDMGTGSGIQAEIALKHRARSILAADVNPQCRVPLQNKGIRFVESDLFSQINDKFDLIIFNPPYLPLDKREDPESALTTTGGKMGDEVILKFLKEAPSHLTSEGSILILISSLTPRTRINRFLEKSNLKAQVLSHKNFFMERLEVWKINK